MLGILWVVAAPGCAAPQAVVRLYPDQGVPVWRAGRATVATERSGLRVAAAFDHQLDNLSGFRVEVENRSASPVDVDPTTLAFVTCVSPKVCSPERAVVDPEKVLIDMDLAHARERADQQNDQAAGTALVLLDVVGGVAEVSSGHARGSGARIAADVAVVQSDGIAHDQQLMMIDSAQKEWSTKALRRTTLFPSQAVGGSVFVPIDRDATIVWLGVPVSGDRFWFSFRQVIETPPHVAGLARVR